MPELLALLLVCSLGTALVRLLDRDATGSLLLGEGILLGLGASTFVMFALSTIGIAWTRLSIGLSAVALLVITLPIVVRRERVAHLPVAWQGSRAVALLFHALTAILLGGYFLFATVAPVWEFDFIGDWGLKARTFWEARGIDWHFLAQPFQRAFHPDYPLLLPLSFDLFAVSRGEWNDRTMGALNVVFALAVLLIIHRLVLEETACRTAAAFATAALLPFAASPWIGLAEGPLVAYGTAGLLLIRRGVQRDLPRSALMGALFLGLAAWTKNEGLTLIVAAALALAVVRRWRELARLWPAVALAAAWLLIRSRYHLPGDLTESGLVSRLVEHIRDPRLLLQSIAQYQVGKPFFWLGIALGIVLTARTLIRHERFLLSALILQFAFYLAAYLASPHDLAWHVRWSWERLISHLTLALAFVVLVHLLILWVRRTPNDVVVAD